MDATIWITTFLIIILSGLNASMPNMLVSVSLLAALVFQLDKDLSSSRYTAPIALAIGSGIFYALAIPSETGTSAIEQTSVIVPLTCFITVLACGTILISQKTVQAFCEWRGEQRGAIILIFPLLWAAAWAAFCNIHPLGRLITWTPSNSMSDLLLPTFGLVGSDFLMASLALVPLLLLTDAFAAGTRSQERALIDVNSVSYFDERTPLLQTLRPDSAGQAGPTSHGKPSRRRLAYVISALTFGLSVLSDFVTASRGSGDTGESVPIACALPKPSRTAPDEPLTVTDYLHESAILTGQGAKIVLWPESAIRLASWSDTSALSAEVGKLAIARRAFIAPSYNAVLKRGSKSVIETTLIGPSEEHNTSQSIFTYRKQALVPIVETYSYTAGDLPSPRGHIEVPAAGRPGRSTSSLDISAAICHDTSFPNILRQSASSQLTLVPSSVFSERIAWTKIYQLRASSRALQTAYLVCETAEQGISAFIDQQGSLRYWQKGGGSFTIHEFFAKKGRQTMYGRLGETGALAVMLAIVLSLILLEELADKGIHSFRGMLEDIKHTLQNKWNDLLGRTSSSSNVERDLLD